MVSRWLQRRFLPAVVLLLMGLAPAWAAAPVITEFSPTSGQFGSTVTLTGSGLTNATQVTVGGVEAAFRVFGSKLLVTVPSGAVTGKIRVTNPDGAFTTTGDFTVIFTPIPVINVFSPGAGGPGTTVIISGANLSGATSVKFNGVAATFVALDAQISVSVPNGATSGPISVTTPGGTATSSATFVVGDSLAPRAISFSPTSGPVGTQVLIQGENIGGLSGVKFGGVSAVFSVLGSQVLAVVPAGAVTGPISLTGPGGTTQSATPFTLSGVSTPSITSVVPERGAPGASVTINGVNLGGANSVKFNGVSAAFFALSSTEISVSVPAGATTGPITVTTIAGAATSPGAFTVTGPLPVISAFSPESGGAGTVVAIQGQHLGAVTSVSFNGVEAVFTALSTNQVIATVPAGPTTGPIRVQTADGVAVSSTPFYAPAAVTSVTPGVGVTGDEIRVLGSSFLGAVVVRLGDVILPFTVVNNNELRVTLTDEAVSGTLRVTTPAGTAAGALRFGVLPRIKSVLPTSGDVGAVLRVRGAAIGSALRVTVGGAAAEFNVVSSMELMVAVPEDAVSGPVVVRTADGEATSSEVFEVALAIRGFEPGTASVDDVVSIRGANFVGVTNVAFNGVNATFAVVRPSEIRATIPAQAATGPVSISTHGGTIFSRDLFHVRPSIRSVTPGSGRPGDIVLINGGGFIGTTNVSFGEVRAAFQVNSPGQIRVVVPDTALTAPVFVISPSGRATSAGPFVVGAAADLGLTASGSVTSLLQGATFTLRFGVTNLGPNAASNVVVTTARPSGLAFVESSSTNVSLLQDGSIVGRFALIPTNSAVSVEMVLRAEEAGVFTNVLTVTSALGDPNPQNDLATVVVSVDPVALPELSIQPLGNGSIALEWPRGLGDLVLQQRLSLTAGEWVTATETGTPTGDRERVVFQASGVARFFRLARP